MPAENIYGQTATPNHVRCLFNEYVRSDSIDLASTVAATPEQVLECGSCAMRLTYIRRETGKQNGQSQFSESVGVTGFEKCVTKQAAENSMCEDSRPNAHPADQ